MGPVDFETKVPLNLRNKGCRDDSTSSVEPTSDLDKRFHDPPSGTVWVMLLGEWWVANPTDSTEPYEPPDPAERVPGTLREVAHGEFALETIGFLGDRPWAGGGRATGPERSRPEIWGTDRDSTYYSLFDNVRWRSTWSPSHVSDGHEDWRVGWLAKGNAWLTSDEDCTSARIQIDDLRAWALHRGPDNIEFDDAWDTATIDLRDETLGTRVIDDASVSLVRASHTRFGTADQKPERHFSYANVVFWKVEGPVKLRVVVTDWIRYFELFSRFMTMEPSVVSRIDCTLDDTDRSRLEVELIARRLQRSNPAADRDDDQSSPLYYLTTLRTLQELGIDPMDVLAGYWREIATGDAYMAMVLHLESQDRLLSRGFEGPLLNAIRSVESLYAVQNSEVRVDRISAQEKIDHAVSCAGDVGSQIRDAWPELLKIGKLRRKVAHGGGRPSAGFDLRCLGGAMALQWVQRLRLLTKLGINQTTARSIVSNNPRYLRDLRTLQNWSAELGAQPTP